MRLIDTYTLELKEFVGSNIPKYAILSHTWEDEEVTLAEFSKLSDACRAKKGFVKIEQTCRLAREQELNYAWVDTCCIDKSSSAELTEAINSMFTWYESSAICFVYLSDLHMVDSIEVELPKCRWFTRGWTLQELIAPNILEFYDATWQLRGNKYNFKWLLERITNIPTFIIWNNIQFPSLIRTRLSSTPISTRMSWAKNRNTTRIEDIAYCLLGIFDVNMPLLYGEGDRAFIRLQEEIIRKDPDATIFLWESSKYDSDFSGVLAPTPSRFTNSSASDGEIKRLESTITNKGIKITTELCSTKILRQVRDGEGARQSNYLLPLCDFRKDIIGLVVEKLSDGTYLRANGVRGGIVRTSRERISRFQEQTLYMMPTGAEEQDRLWYYRYRKSGCQLELGRGLQLLLATPVENWDPLSSIIRDGVPMAFLLAFGSQPPNLFLIMSMDFKRGNGIYIIEYSNPAAHYIFTKMAELKPDDTVLSDFWGLECMRFEKNRLATTKIRTDTGSLMVHLQGTPDPYGFFTKIEISCSL